MANNSTLQSELIKLAAARAKREELKAKLAKLREEFNNLNADLVVGEKEAAAAIELLELNIKSLALAAYKITKNKKPVEGVDVKVYDVYEYDQEKAFAWAKQTGIALLPESLDVSAFEKIAKATPLDFVKTAEEPRIQIARDLTKAVANISVAEAEIDDDFDEVPF